MKKFSIAVCVTALAFATGMTAYAAETLDREYIESEIWEDVWHGKDDNGLDFPEASFKHHLLAEWLDKNYGSDDYDWTELGELKYEYKDYYSRLTENWDFEDDKNGSWTIDTEDNHYSFVMMNDSWQMIDQNGDTVDSFPPFSTLEETADGYEMQDDGANSPRVIGNVKDGTETASEDVSGVEREVTAEDEVNGSESNSERSGVSPLAVIAGVVAVAGIGGARYYMIIRKKESK